MTTYYKKAKKLLKQKPKDIKVKAPSNPKYNHTINEKVYKNDYMDMLKRFVDYCEKNKQYPNYVMTKQSKTPSSYKLFCFCIDKIEKFVKENGYYPNWCVFNYKDIQNKQSSATKVNNCSNPYTSTPHHTTTSTGLGQKYNWDCSANAMNQCLYKLSKKDISEDTLIKVGGVTHNGVGHMGINTMVAWFNKKYKTNYKVTWKNFSDMGKTRDERFTALAKLLCKKNVAVLTHIGYANSGERPITSSSSTIFGHYEVLDKVDVKNKTVRALNSLGTKCGSAYCGHLQTRTYETQASYFLHTPFNQKALCIIEAK